MRKPEKPYHHGDLRRALVETALEMLGEDQGWQFTLRELSRRAGVSHTAAYKHFDDKAALLAELAALGFDRLSATTQAVRAGAAASLKEEFIARCRAYVRFGTENANLYRLMFSPDARAAKESRLAEHAGASFAGLLDLIRRGQAAGWLRAGDAQAKAVACWTQLHGLTLLSADDLLGAYKLGPDPAKVAVMALLEGLEAREAEHR
jgi:AcrR family transcriptional regulator